MKLKLCSRDYREGCVIKSQFKIQFLNLIKLFCVLEDDIRYEEVE
jgi:hypothetical protein